MSENKKYGGYSNIDFDHENEPEDKNYKIREQHTLDFYNEEMSRKAVKSMFPDEHTQKEERGYDGSNKYNTLSKPANPQNSYNPKKTDKNGNFEYTHQSIDYEKLNEVSRGYAYGNANKERDFRNTSFSHEKIEAERKSREDVERNKQILKEMERQDYVPKNRTMKEFKTVEELQETIKTSPIRRKTNNTKQKRAMIFRLCTMAFICIILISLGFSLYKVRDYKSQINDLNAQVAILTEANTQVQDLETQVKILNDELTKYKSAEVAQTTPDADKTEENTEKTTEYVVKNGDTLSSISEEVYGDSGRYNEIYEANDLKTADLLVGQKLLIP